MAGKKQRKPKTVKALVLPKLREVNRYWHEKKQARKDAKVKVKVGTYKNGNPIMRTKFKCASCDGVFDRKETHMDHKNPVVPIDLKKIVKKYKEIFSDDFLNVIKKDRKESEQFLEIIIIIARLFCKKSEYQCLCINCHKQKTLKENISRKEVRNGKIRKS